MEDSRSTSELEYPFAKKRVIHFPFQVKSPDELRVGKVYIPVYKSQNGDFEPKTHIKISRANPKKNLTTVTKVYLESDTFNKIKYHLSDYGIVPYKSGLWNAAYCLVPALHESKLLKIIAERSKK